MVASYITQERIMKIFKVEAEGDTLYIQAESQKAARKQLHDKIGYVPDGMLTWSEVESLPEGQELL